MQGLSVDRVNPEGLGARAGLKTGDVIVGCNWAPIPKPSGLSDTLSGAFLWNYLVVARDNKLLHLRVGCGSLDIQVTPALGAVTQEYTISSVTKGSAMHVVGLLPGDRVLSVNGAALTDQLTPNSLFENAGPNYLHVRRGTRQMAIEYSAATELPIHLSAPPGCSNGKRLLVGSIKEESPAQTAGIEPGDIIVECNGLPLRSPRDLVEKLASSDVNCVSLVRGNNLHQFALPRGPVGITIGNNTRVVSGAAVNVVDDAASQLPGLTTEQNIVASHALAISVSIVAIKALVALIGGIMLGIPFATSLLTLCICATGSVLLKRCLSRLPEGHSLHLSIKLAFMALSIQAGLEMTFAVEQLIGVTNYLGPACYVSGLVFALAVYALVHYSAKTLGGRFRRKLLGLGGARQSLATFITFVLFAPAVLVAVPMSAVFAGLSMSRHLRSSPPPPLLSAAATE